MAAALRRRAQRLQTPPRRLPKPLQPTAGCQEKAQPWLRGAHPRFPLTGFPAPGRGFPVCRGSGIPPEQSPVLAVGREARLGGSSPPRVTHVASGLRDASCRGLTLRGGSPRSRGPSLGTGSTCREAAVPQLGPRVSRPGGRRRRGGSAGCAGAPWERPPGLRAEEGRSSSTAAALQSRPCVTLSKAVIRRCQRRCRSSPVQPCVASASSSPGRGQSCRHGAGQELGPRRSPAPAATHRGPSHAGLRAEPRFGRQREGFRPISCHRVSQLGVWRAPPGIPVLTGTLPASPRPQEMRDLPVRSSHKCIWGLWGFPGCSRCFACLGLILVLASCCGRRGSAPGSTLGTTGRIPTSPTDPRPPRPLLSPPSNVVGIWVRSLNVVVRGRSTHAAAVQPRFPGKPDQKSRQDSEGSPA